ncbi:MAG: RnfABCDGE type electron transport complex subunit B [Gammaproteobacteria bacterium]|nr:RnfABCDGE type electron transport complex subunit B [Gammaproteobacteria bacterium]
MTSKTNAPDFKYAVIDASQCIGCTKCLPACPVDAIVGASEQLHAVLVAECIGCGLCLAPCPMDCIHMQASPVALFSKEKARWRHQQRQQRAQIQRQLSAPVPSLEMRKKEIQDILGRDC